MSSIGGLLPKTELSGPHFKRCAWATRWPLCVVCRARGSASLCCHHTETSSLVRAGRAEPSATVVCKYNGAASAACV